jgi:hypothetical protein
MLRSEFSLRPEFGECTNAKDATTCTTPQERASPLEILASKFTIIRIGEISPGKIIEDITRAQAEHLTHIFRKTTGCKIEGDTIH